MASIQITSPAGTGYSLTIDSTNGNPVTAGNLNYSGAGRLIKIGLGSATLSAANGYSGGTVVAAGTLIVTSASALASGSSLTVGMGAFQLLGAVAAPTQSPAAVASTAIAASTSPSSRVAIAGSLSLHALKSAVFAAPDAAHSPSTSIGDNALQLAADAFLARKVAWPAVWEDSSSSVDRQDKRVLAVEALDAVFIDYGRQ